MVLDLRVNELSGPVPGWLGELPHLRALGLGRNRLGEVPPELEALTGLNAMSHWKDEWFSSPPRGPVPGSCEALAGGVSSDREVLAALYHATDGERWAGPTWLSDAPLDEWRGVSTDSFGRVRRLSLDSAGLRGEIPRELGRLCHVHVLNLGGNELSRAIPRELGSLPNLRWLDRSGNRLSGEIPRELGQQLPRACYVGRLLTGFAGNRLTGCVPARLYLGPIGSEDLPYCSWALEAPWTGGAGLLAAAERDALTAGSRRVAARCHRRCAPSVHSSQAAGAPEHRRYRPGAVRSGQDSGQARSCESRPDSRGAPVPAPRNSLHPWAELIQSEWPEARLMLTVRARAEPPPRDGASRGGGQSARRATLPRPARPSSLADPGWQRPR